MIGRLFHTATAAVLYFCLATLIAEAILVHHVWTRWKIDRGRLVQIVAAAQGNEALSARQKKGDGREGISGEQPSYEQILGARMAKDMNLQLREQSLDSSLAALRNEQQTLNQSQEQYAQQRQQYQSELRTLENNTAVAGREINLSTLQTIKPKQAKDLLMQMLRSSNASDTTAAVMLLRDMADNKRAKIIAEFKTPDEAAKIEEVLRAIRAGTPEGGIAKEAEKRLQGKQP